VPPHHPLRTIKRFADRALAELSPTTAMARGGRPSIPPERIACQSADQPVLGAQTRVLREGAGITSCCGVGLT